MDHRTKIAPAMAVISRDSQMVRLAVGRSALFLALCGLLPAASLNAQAPAKTVSPKSSIDKADATPPVEAPPVRPSPLALTSEAERPWELNPYRVTVHLVFGPNRQLTPAFREEVQSEIEESIADQAGSTWDAILHPVVSAAWGSAAGMGRLTKEQLPVVTVATALPDKQFFIAVNQAGSRYSVAVREWDEVTQDFSPVQSAETLVRDRVAGIAAGLLSRVFRPLLRVEGTVPDSYDVMLLLRAGSLIPLEAVTDSTADTLRYHVRPGSLLLPFFRYAERNGNFRTNQFLPWTFLEVVAINRGRVRCSITTGVRANVAVRQSKRVKSLAVATQPLFDKTNVELRLRRNTDRKLAAHDLLIASSKKLNTDPQALLDERFTDRRGIAAVPQYPGTPIVWIYIKSGLQLLAKLPFVPGLQRDIAIDLPDDAGRLLVEGELAQIRGQLVDTIARQQAAMIRARKAAKANDWTKVDAEMKKIDALPARDDVLEELGKHRDAALLDAREQRNRTAEKKIFELSSETVELINRYLDPKKRDEFQQEIDGLRK